MRNQVTICLVLLVISYVESSSVLPDISSLKHSLVDVQKLKRSVNIGCTEEDVEKFGTEFSECVEKTTMEHLQKIISQVPNINAMKGTTCQMLTQSVGCVAKTSPKCSSKAEREEMEKAVLEQLVQMVKNQPSFGEEFISGCPILVKG